MTTNRQVIEETLGEPLDTDKWKKRMKEGFLITLKIKRWRARKKLTLQELGIYPPNNEVRVAYEQLLTLGSKSLLPMETQRELDAIERGARMHLAGYAIETPFGLFVPYTTYRMWKNGNQEYKERFFAKRNEIVTSYWTLVEKLLSEYEKIARHTYKLLMNQASELMSGYPDEEAFVAHFRQEAILRNIKTSQEFYDSFVYEETFSRVDRVTNLDADTETVEEEEADAVVSEREAQQEAAEVRRRELIAMNRDLVQKAREQKEALIDRFLTSLLAQLRSQVYEAVTSVLASIKEQDTLQGRPAIQLRNLVDQLKSLNFYGDRDIDAILTLLHSIIEKPAKERDISEVTRQLRTIGTLTRGSILALGEQPREGRDIQIAEIGISLVPDEEEVREARGEILEAAQRIILSDVRQEREDMVVSLAHVGSDEERQEREA